MPDDQDTDLTRREYLRLAAMAGVPLGAVSEVEARDVRQASDDEAESILVGVEEGIDDPAAWARENVTDGEVVTASETLGFVKVRFPGFSSEEQEQRKGTLENDPQVRYAEDDGRKEAFLVPDDGLFSSQYAPQSVNAPQAWDKTTGSSDVTIAVIDQGTKYDHPDLSGNMDGTVSNHGYDFVDGNGDPYPTDLSTNDGDDAEYHGTHVSGIAGGATNNAEGVAGLSDCSLQSVRVLGEDGYGYWSDIALGIEWAADNGADIINMSLGGSSQSSTVTDACQYATNNGVTIFAAAGNTGTNEYHYPAANQYCISVTAIDYNDDFASFSTYNDDVELTAPGVSVLSTYPYDESTGDPADTYDYLSGTSMATPVAAGVAGLALSRLDWLTNDELRAHMKNTAEDIGLSSNRQGAGKVDAAAAVSVPDHSHVGDQWSGASCLEIESTSGNALYARTTGSNPTDSGVYGISTAQQGYGVHGRATASSGANFGLWGLSFSTEGTGMYGKANNSSGSTVGVRGVSVSPDGRGISGENHAASGATTGTYGVVTSSTNGAAAVHGRAAADSGTTIGVRGDVDSPNGYGLYTPDDANVGGTLTTTNLQTTGTKNFVQAVETSEGTSKEVVYSAVEAGTPHTEVSGTAVLEDGRAVVELPRHFRLVTSEASDLVVQVTPHSHEATGPAVVERSLERLVIEDRDGDGDYEVSYTVKGTRDGFEDTEVVREPDSPVQPPSPSIDD